MSFSGGPDRHRAAAPVAMPHVARWQAGRLRAALATATYPLFWLLNRPRMAWFGRAAYDFALRCNGIAINFKGEHGLTAGEAALLRRIAPGLRGAVVLDVGANTGTYASALAQLAPDARIIAFEPHPRTFGVLRQRLAATRVEVLNMAVADAAGELTLHDFAAADGSTQASLSHDAVALYGEATVAHAVAVTTIDSFLAERGIAEVAYLKVDTEGFDLNVIRGAREAIASGRIRMIQFEFIAANIATRVSMRDFFEALPGYDIHRLCLNGALLPLAPYSVKRCEIFVNHNLVAVRRGSARLP